jgi:hypothetical protein
MPAGWRRDAGKTAGDRRNMTATEQLLTSKELAAELRKSIRFVRYMRAQGFAMPGNIATLREARQWLLTNPAPTRPRTKCTNLHLSAP